MHHRSNILLLVHCGASKYFEEHYSMGSSNVSWKHNLRLLLHSNIICAATSSVSMNGSQTSTSAESYES